MTLRQLKGWMDRATDKNRLFPVDWDAEIRVANIPVDVPSEGRPGEPIWGIGGYGDCVVILTGEAKLKLTESPCFVIQAEEKP